ncbi:MAG: BON domain-containing protein [Betaproteobacteria bacterium]
MIRGHLSIRTKQNGLLALALIVLASATLAVAEFAAAAGAAAAPAASGGLGAQLAQEPGQAQQAAQVQQPVAVTANPTFAVVVGESRILQVNGLVRVAVADPNIADVVVVSKTEVIVNGKAEGRTTLHVWDAQGRSSYDVRVCVDNADLVREIEETIGISGVKARFARSTLLLDGVVETDADSERAERIAKAYTDKVLNLLTVRRPTLPPQPPVIAASEVQDAIGVPGVSVRVLKDAVILEGQVENPLDSDRAEKIARIFSNQVLNFIVVTPPSPSDEAVAEGKPAPASPPSAQGAGAPLPSQPGAQAEAGAGGGGATGEAVAAAEAEKAQAPLEAESSAAEKVDPDTALRDAIVAAVRDPAVEVTVVKGKVLLEGLVSSDYAKLRAETVARLYASDVVSIIRVEEPEPAPAASLPPPASASTPAVREAVPAPAPEPAAAPATPATPPEPSLEDRVGAFINVPTVSVRSVDGKLLLEGTVPSQSELERVGKIAAMFSKDVVNLVEMTDPLQVLLQVNVVEVNKDALKNLGVTWGGVNGERIEPGSFLFGEVSFPPLPPLPTDVTTWEAWRQLIPHGSPIEEIWRLSPIRAVLDLLVNDNAAKVLAAPSLLTLSGEQADFLVGGEIPVYAGQSDGKIAFEWRPYGIKLTMLPVVDSRGRVAIDVQPEVSSLDWNNALDVGDAVIPALKVRRASTHLIVDDGATIAIGGLLQNNDAKIVNKIPILGDIPIIGSLFRSEKFERGESELVILITTKVVKTGEPVTRDMMLQPTPPASAEESSPPASAARGSGK